MSRYEYDLFVSFHSESKKSVTKFLSKYQRQSNWRVFLAECDLDATNKQLHEAMHKSRLVFTVTSHGCDDNDACETHKIASCTLFKLHYEICWHHLKKSGVKQETFENLHIMLAQMIRDEKNTKFAYEIAERRERMGRLDLQIQEAYQEKYAVYRQNMFKAKMFMALSGNLSRQWKLKNGSYHGQFDRDGLREGVGSIDYFNGETYSGEWKNDKKHGFGSYAYKDGAEYEGEWVNSTKEGLCVIRKGESVTYRGYMKNGEKNGKGIFEYTCGSRYGGDCLNDHKSGSGVFFNFSNEELYDGEWLNNKKHGRGVYIYKNDMKYDGEWADDVKHGRGILWFSNGDRFEGLWVKGKKQGDGILYAANGELFYCSYDNDKEMRKEKKTQDAVAQNDEAVVVKKIGEFTWKVDKSKPKPYSIISGENVIVEATLAELDDLIAQIHSVKMC